MFQDFPAVYAHPFLSPPAQFHLAVVAVMCSSSIQGHMATKVRNKGFAQEIYRFMQNKSEFNPLPESSLYLRVLWVWSVSSEKYTAFLLPPFLLLRLPFLVVLWILLVYRSPSFKIQIKDPAIRKPILQIAESYSMLMTPGLLCCTFPSITLHCVPGSCYHMEAVIH